jgi:hypothetical protein
MELSEENIKSLNHETPASRPLSRESSPPTCSHLKEEATIMAKRLIRFGHEARLNRVGVRLLDGKLRAQAGQDSSEQLDWQLTHEKMKQIYDPVHKACFPMKDIEFASAEEQQGQDKVDEDHRILLDKMKFWMGDGECSTFVEL